MSLDESRKRDVSDLKAALRYGTEKEKHAAKRALESIAREQRNSKVLDARKWMLNELKQGRFENVRNFYADSEKDSRLRNE